MHKRRFPASIAVLALLVASLAPGAIAQTPSRFTRLDVAGVKPYLDRLQSANPARQLTVIVGLDGTPLAQRIAQARAQGKTLTKAERSGILKDLKSAQAPTLARAKTLGKVSQTYQAAYSGFSIRIAAGKLAALRSLPGVQSVTPTQKFTIDNERSVPFIGAPAAWADYGYTGAGVKIGVIDTGIDYYHANFGGSGNPADFAADDGLTIGTPAFPNAKVVGGFDFVGDAYDADTPVPDPDPLDCNGHGSHTAGTAGGAGVLSTGATYAGAYNATTVSGNTWKIGPGVAPQASIYAYRVFGCAGSANDDVIIAAIDQAIIDGVDVINMSLGAPFGTDSAPDAIASNNASAAGVTVVASAGNSGPAPYLVGSPSVATSAISVAAEDGGFSTVPTLTIDLAGIGTMANNNAALVTSVGPATVTVLQSAPGVVALGCSASDYAGTAGQIVVVKRGTCARVDRAIFGQAAGAAAVIMINNSSGLPPFEGPIPTVSIPFIGAAGGTGAAFLAGDTTSHTITAGASIASPSYRHIASFSSGGPRTGDSAAKPDITAPGVSTVSTAAGTGTNGETLSGTSMAAPHVAGSAALVVQAHPSWTPEQIKAALMNTASTAAAFLASSADRNIRLAGPGAVQPRSAVDTQILATTGPGQASMSFNAPESNGAYSANRQITFWNTGATAVTLNLTHAFQSAGGAVARFSKTSVNVPAFGSASVTFKLSFSAGAVAAFPGAESSNFGVLVTRRGTVAATPTTAGPGLYTLHIPWLMAPRGTSAIKPSSTTQNFGTASSKVVTLKNTGGHGGNADFYALGQTSPDSGLGAADIHATGVQALPGGALGGDSSDRSLVFAINNFGSWSNPSQYEFDVYVDTNADSLPDYDIVGFDIGYIFTGTFSGQYASLIFTYPGFALVDAWVADAPMNGSTLLLPALASEIGLSAGSPTFQYAVGSFDLFTGGADSVGFANFNAYSQPVSTGDYVAVGPGATVTDTLVIDRTSLLTSPVAGWLVQTMDDASGAKQADVLKLTYTP